MAARPRRLPVFEPLPNGRRLLRTCQPCPAAVSPWKYGKDAGIELAAKQAGDPRMPPIRVDDLHKEWLKDPEYRRGYDALEDEFALISALIGARARGPLPWGGQAAIRVA